MDGFLLVWKPKGWSSFDVVRYVKYRTEVRKVGHGGTLDKEAEGLLIILLGKATKFHSYITNLEKEYITAIKLGEFRDTDDFTGKVIARFPVNNVTHSKVEEVLDSFRGEFYQIVPKYSALKYHGRPFYKWAREGKDPPLRKRKAYIKEIELLEFKPPELRLRIVCGRGVYIRGLARDIGQRLGTGGYVDYLLRTRVGNFKLDNAAKIEDISEREQIVQRMLPVELLVRG